NEESVFFPVLNEDFGVPFSSERKTASAYVRKSSKHLKPLPERHDVPGRGKRQRRERITNKEEKFAVQEIIHVEDGEEVSEKLCDDVVDVTAVMKSDVMSVDSSGSEISESESNSSSEAPPTRALIQSTISIFLKGNSGSSQVADTAGPLIV